MNNFNKIYIALSLLIGFISCEKEVQIKLPNSENKIVINGLINSDQPWK